MPLDRDNDLLVDGSVDGSSTADVNGAYFHTGSQIRNRDAGFQGFGKFITGSTGEYVFRTIKPGIYPGRTRQFTTQ